MDDAQRERLNELTEMLAEGQADEAAFLELDRLLLNDPEAQRHYLRRIDLHHSLEWMVAGDATWRAMKRMREAGLAPVRPAGRRLRIAAAAVIFVALAYPFFRGTPEAPAPSRAGRSWEGAVLRAGDSVRVPEGSATVQFNGGIRAILRGPAALDVPGADHAALKQGALSVRVPPSAAPFRLSAHGLEITTRGSEFGVGADPQGRVRLSVLSGEVVAAATGDVPQTVRLTSDESLTRDADGTLTTNILGAGFPFPRLGGQVDPRFPVLVNGGFEVPRTAQALAAANWVLEVHPRANAENMDIEAGAGATAAGPGTPTAAEGSQWGYLNARTFSDGRRYTTSMHQAVGPLVAGAIYEIELTIGRTAETHWAGLVVGLYTGSAVEGPETPLRQWTDPVRLSPRQRAGAKLIYECPADAADAGRTLFLRLATTPATRPGLSRILVDDIRLSVRLPRTDERNPR